MYKWLPFSFYSVFLIAACGSQSAETVAQPALQPDTIIYQKDSTLFFNSPVAQFLDVKTFRPDTVYWSNKKFNDTDTLEAVLIYPKLTYGAILEKYMDADFPKANYNKNDFAFSWLGNKLLQELHYSKPDYHGNPDIFLTKNKNAALWFLNNKILVRLPQ